MSQRIGARADVRAHPETAMRVARAAASLLVLAGLTTMLFAIKASAAPVKASEQSVVRLVHVLEIERTGVSSPAGLAFSPSSNSFHA